MVVEQTVEEVASTIEQDPNEHWAGSEMVKKEDTLFATVAELEL